MLTSPRTHQTSFHMGTRILNCNCASWRCDENSPKSAYFYDGTRLVDWINREVSARLKEGSHMSLERKPLPASIAVHDAAE
jgi:hypothetical protein